MKKSVKNGFKRMLKALSVEERKEALQWIDSLSEKELKAFEGSDRLRQAKALLTAYLKKIQKKEKW